MTTITLDGSLSDWPTTAQLDTDTNAAPDHDFYGLRDGETFYLALAIDPDTTNPTPTPVSVNTTIWIDSDLNAATGKDVFGAGIGADYRIEVQSDGLGGYDVNLYDAVGFDTDPGTALVASLNFAVDSTSSTSVLEIELPRSLIASPDFVRVYSDVSDAAFLPSGYSATNYIVGEMPTIGSITLDGSIADWSADQRLDTPLTGAAGFGVYGTLEGSTFVFALTADAVSIGQNTTIWLDTDLDRSTGQVVFGPGIAGSEFNINIGADGVAKLYSGPAGDTFVADLDFKVSADGSVFEVAVEKTLIGSPDWVRVFSDVNNLGASSLPNDYATQNHIAGAEQPDTSGELKVAIVYSETSAANYFDVTAYGQLVMSAQNQAMQAGIPYDLLSEDDLKDPAFLGSYDVIVFPYMANVNSADVDDITSALTIAQKYYGTGLIAGGDFMTNDENGAALAGDAYARQKALLGVTFEGFGSTTGVDVVAEAGTNPILDGYAPGTVVGEYTNSSYSHYTDITGSGEVLFSQQVDDTTTGPATHDAVIATTTQGRNVHFASDAVIGNNNILGEAIDWVARGDDVDLRLSLTRDTSLFFSRNDMDQSQEIFDVQTADPNIYDVMLPIITDWYETYDFVGSYYINIGLFPGSPEFQDTDWSVSKPYYDAIQALESEIGSHSWTHPDNTNLLVAPGANGTLDALVDSVLLFLNDPGAVGAQDPFLLSKADRQFLATSFQFQFELSKLKIEQELGITVAGAAVPGAPESVATSREIIKYYDYLSGGYSSTGAGYPNAFGYLSPDDMGAVYIAPNMSFDFTLIGFQGLTPAEAELVWENEYREIVDFGTAPIIVWPWHDYGPTQWIVDPPNPSGYTLEMFTNFIARAAAEGTEFVTGKDLAERIASFEASGLTVTQAGNVVTATVTSPDAGNFALTLKDGDTIASVANWYAWNGNKVFLPEAGGTFEITLGAEVDTLRLADLPMRASLVSVTGNGEDLAFTFTGKGDVVIDLIDQATSSVFVNFAGPDAINRAGEILTLSFDTPATHSASVRQVVSLTAVGTAADELVFAGEGATVDAAGGSDRVLGAGLGEDLSGGEGNDYINGLAGYDTLRGDGGDDKLIDTEAGGNAFYGGDGNDRISGGDGNDYVEGGANDDIIKPGDGDDTIYGGDDNDIILAGSGNDTVYGDGGNDVIKSGLGDDVIYGGDGDDIIFTWRGNDTAYGGAGNDVLRGDFDADFLEGGAGDDRLVGAPGFDTFIFRDGFEEDKVLDFTKGSDKFDFSMHTGVDEFTDLAIFEVGGLHTVVRDGFGGRLVIANTLPTEIDATDFIFSV